MKCVCVSSEFVKVWLCVENGKVYFQREIARSQRFPLLVTSGTQLQVLLLCGKIWIGGVYKEEIDSYSYRAVCRNVRQKPKSDQLDVHVRFWNSGIVKSRYLGSQFMGHRTWDSAGPTETCQSKWNLNGLFFYLSLLRQESDVCLHIWSCSLHRKSNLTLFMF